MEIEDYITSEAIRKRFKNQFDMVNYAISLARIKIREGRETFDNENPAVEVVDDILYSLDHLPDTDRSITPVSKADI